MKKQFITILAAGLIAAATTAPAAVRQGEFSLSPVIGGYTFDGKQHLNTNLVYGGRAGYTFTKHIGFEGLFDYVNTDSTRGGSNMKGYRYGGELLYHFLPDNRLVPYIAAGGGGITVEGDHFRRTRAMYDYGLGLKYFVSDAVALRGDVRHILYTYGGTTFNNLEYTIGAYIPFGGAKPAAKPVAAEPVAEKPAPAPAPAPVAAPAPPAPEDNLTVSPASVTKGQPATLTWTSQNATNCEIQPGIGPVQLQGSLTVTPAADTSYTLICNGAGGTARSAANLAVTVPPPPPVVEAAQPKASAAKLCQPTVINIQFDTNKANIKPQYHDELKTLADFLVEFPKATGVIEGHTDSVGSKASNMKLSQRRADSVRTYVIKKFGIAPERISAKGFGPTKPIADNKTAAGKQKNRRIEANFSCDGN